MSARHDQQASQMDLAARYLSDCTALRARFLADLLCAYRKEQADNSINPATTLSEKLGVNYGTLHGWLQRARRAETASR